MNKTYFFIIIQLLLMLCSPKAQSQQWRLDSLHVLLKNTPDDTVRMITLSTLRNFYAESNRDSALYYAEAYIGTAKKLNQPLWVAQGLLGKAYVIQKQVNFSLSLKLCNEALAIVEDKRNEKNAYIPIEREFADDPSKFRKSILINVFHQLGNTYSGAGNNEKAIEYYQKEIQVADELKSKSGRVTSNMNIGTIYLKMEKLDSAFIYSTRALKNSNLTGWKSYAGLILRDIGIIYSKKGQLDSARYYYQQSLRVNKEQNNVAGEITTSVAFARFYQKLLQADSMKHHANSAFELATKLKAGFSIESAANLLSNAWKMQGNADSALFYLALSKNISDSLYTDLTGKLTQFQNTNFEEQMQLEKAAQESIAAKNRIRTISLLTGLGLLSILVFIFYRSTIQKHKANKVLEKTLSDLKATQSQLIQSEKMASLGELTAGIAHEIQNPLNFVNNFSEVNKELLTEMSDAISKGDIHEAQSLAKSVIDNQEKINHHGKRADAIVKGMLQHSRSSSGQKELTDINVLCDEYLRLGYHGLRAKDKSSHAKFETDFDSSLPKVNVVPQDIGRVVLNLINNAFFAVNEKRSTKNDSYEPTVTVSTRKASDKIEIRVKDNGNGITESIKDKIFQPFFTTKPTGHGTGLGLSLSYDIVKTHGGELRVETREGQGSDFVIQLPV